MSLILNIDTASEKAHVSFAKDGMVLDSISSGSQKEHASFLQSAIQQLTKITGIVLKDINAVAVTAGPGSYTGLRVGMASAKGLSYALKKPLITISSLEVLTASALQLFPGTDKTILLCPMLDARRMEVFTAVYLNDLLKNGVRFRHEDISVIYIFHILLGLFYCLFVCPYDYLLIHGPIENRT